MGKWSRIGLILAVLGLAAPQAAFPQANATDTFVKGATDFLLDRGNDNYIYIFQKKCWSGLALHSYSLNLRLILSS